MHKGDVLVALYFIARGTIEIIIDDIVVETLGQCEMELLCAHSKKQYHAIKRRRIALKAGFPVPHISVQIGLFTSKLLTP